MSAFEECRQIREEHQSFVSRIVSLAKSLDGSVMPGNSAMPVSQHLVLRGLYDSEQTALRASHNEWSHNKCNLYLIVPTTQQYHDQSKRLQQLVTHNGLDDLIVFLLGDICQTSSSTTTKKTPVTLLRPGVHDNIKISNCLIHVGACVCRNAWIKDTYIGSQATLMNCGQVLGGGPLDTVKRTLTDHDHALKTIHVGPEAGGQRPLHLTLESTMIHVGQQLVNSTNTSPPTTTTTNDSASMKQKQHHAIDTCHFTILCRASLVRDTPTIHHVFVYPDASIEAATRVSHATLYPTAQIRDASTVHAVGLQWNTVISDGSTVSNALLMEGSHVGPHSIVAQSVLGPDVHVSAGEVHASILGPNCNAHHQSLVISVLWPLGRGNVGYGANVGSNHTGRLPDQETISGEGIFWGLSCVITFPVNCQDAPYSIVAAGTILPPQRLQMPFALIVAHHGVNQIVPGWVLNSSTYTLARSDHKFTTRRTATRHNFYTGWKIIRPETVELCHRARQMLQSVSEIKPVYKASDIAGIGASEMTEKGRQTGIVAYTECIQRYALHGLLFFLQRVFPDGKLNEQYLQKEFSQALECTLPIEQDEVEWNSFPWQVDDTMEWTYQKAMITTEFPCPDGNYLIWIQTLLQTLIRLEHSYGQRVYLSKHRDDVRGASVIPDYSLVHVSAADDPIIQHIQSECQSIETVARKWIHNHQDALHSRL